jgi:hypothetical protein
MLTALLLLLLLCLQVGSLYIIITSWQTFKIFAN